jgi:hypothetical protein
MTHARFSQHLKALAAECDGYETSWSDMHVGYKTSLDELQSAVATGNRRAALGHLHFAAGCLDVYLSEHASRLLAAMEYERGAQKLKAGCIARYIRDSAALAIMREFPTRNVGMTRAKGLAQIAYVKALGPSEIMTGLGKVIDAIDRRGGLSSPKSTQARRHVEVLRIAALGDAARLVPTVLVSECLDRALTEGDIDIISAEDGCLGTWPAELLVVSVMSAHHLCDAAMLDNADRDLRAWLRGIDELTRLAPLQSGTVDTRELVEAASSIIDIAAAR